MLLWETFAKIVKGLNALFRRVIKPYAWRPFKGSYEHEATSEVGPFFNSCCPDEGLEVVFNTIIVSLSGFETRTQQFVWEKQDKLLGL
ncbi:hypothetical protein HanXRQr2_Chr08g0337711 [Helianthus annuus]|uniref:Uncharacterized protein n=1 Tax=Helianthus annuus TaxID=4232 RepID=A0A9K3IEA8_HELAN|nr:hypothetical protein HanXRQr2_Chr08g0337711 [Helianthus annuus]KAJ0901509.1 hypothetical protein HanPSC8_Chr08g0326141 [Helianthus annuus]